MSVDNLPTFVIIGAMKSATTSLYYYLSLHPEIYMSKIKELWYFVNERNWPRGLNWYKSYFKSNAPMRGEASTGYTMYPRFAGVPKRMHAVLPNAKLVYIVRDPIQRLVSDYMHHVTFGMIHQTLDETLASHYGEHLIARSRYYHQITQYLPLFSQDNIYILTFEALRDNRNATLNELFRFLGVDDGFTSDKFGAIMHATASKRRLTPLGRKMFRFSERHMNRYHPGAQQLIVKHLCLPFSRAVESLQLNDSLRLDLIERLAPDVEQFRAFTGKPFDEWTI